MSGVFASGPGSGQRTEQRSEHAPEPGLADSPYHLELAPGWWLWRTAALRSAGMPFDWLAPLACPAEATEDEVAARSRAAVLALVRQPRFGAALAWQNPDLMANWVLGFITAAGVEPDPHLHRRGQREAKLARYAQRYCAKNDTVGFFGPVGWAELDDDSQGIAVESDLSLAARSVHLESWVLHRLVARWAADPELAPHLPVRLPAPAWYDGSTVRLPNRRPVPVDPSAKAVLDTIVGKPEGEILPEAHAPVVAQLRRAGLVNVGFPVPIDDRPERALARRIEAGPESKHRERMRAELAELELLRERAERAEEPADVVSALVDAQRTATRLTGEAPARTTQSGRTPLYLDCRRAGTVRIGPDVWHRLSAPLRIVLDSARWFIGQLAEELRGQLSARFRELRSGGRPVTVSDLLFASADVLSGAPGTIVDDVVADLESRWAELLRTSQPGGRLDSTQLAPLVEALFPPGPVPWAAGRYHSPDLLLGRLDGADQPPVWVLGELHVAFNGLENRVFHTQSPSPEQLAAAAGLDLPTGRILPLYPITSAEVGSRTYPPSAVHLPDRFAYWSYADDDGHPGGAATVPGTAILVEEHAGELVGVPSGQSWCAPVLEFLGEFATALAVNRFRIRPPRPAAPRVRIDDLVVARSAWRIPIAELAPVCEPRGRRFAALRAELLARGIPRHLFYRTSVEPKPCYADLEAPLLLRALADTVRRQERAGGGELDLTEMLPGPEHLWLTGPDGRLTSELRTVVVDDRPAPAVFRSRPGAP